MTVVAYTPLHYGRDYLAWAIRSIIDAVDAYYVIYTPVGSHGHRTSLPCPETRDELYAIAREAAGHKLHWFEGTFAYEGQQRDLINELAPDADVILALDADEIWGEGLADYCVEMATKLSFHKAQLPLIHYWRSFHRAVLHDPAYPERVICPGRVGNIMCWPQNVQPSINHMGYAQRAEIVEYKQHVHGHKGEWRQDDWFHTVFMANARTR